MYLFLFSVLILSQFSGHSCMFWHHLCSVLTHKRNHDVIFCPKKQKKHQADAPQLWYKNRILSLHKLPFWGRLRKMPNNWWPISYKYWKSFSGRDFVLLILDGAMCETVSYPFCPHGGTHVQTQVTGCTRFYILCWCCQWMTLDRLILEGSAAATSTWFHR